MSGVPPGDGHAGTIVHTEAWKKLEALWSSGFSICRTQLMILSEKMKCMYHTGLMLMAAIESNENDYCYSGKQKTRDLQEGWEEGGLGPGRYKLLQDCEGKNEDVTRGEAKNNERLARAREQGVRAVWRSLWTASRALSSLEVGSQKPESGTHHSICSLSVLAPLKGMVDCFTSRDTDRGPCYSNTDGKRSGILLMKEEPAT